MKPFPAQAKVRQIRYGQWAEWLMLFGSTLFIYLANGAIISSNDSVPSSLLAFNWLENHTLHFDAFRGGHYYMPNDIFGQNGIPYFFTESPTGHLTSAYPIGTALLSFPLYALFFLYLKLSAILQHQPLGLDITNPAFEPQRQFYEKLAGAILAALTNVIFYLLARLKFDRSISLLITFIYGFATLNWAVSSQGLWAHTLSNLALVCILLCLWKANRLEGESLSHRRKTMLVTAGFFSGLLPAIRPTGLLFLAAILVYVVVTYRRETLFFLIGGLSFLFNSAWNVYYFGFSLRVLIVGGYSSLFQHSSTYDWTLSYFNTAFWGYLISPSRGLLIFSPVLLFSIPGWYQVYKRRSQTDERLLILLGIACLVLFIQYCFYVPWWGAITYGSRFLVDFLPVLCYPIAYVLAHLLNQLEQSRKRVSVLLVSVFLLLTVYSTFVQVVGAFSDRHIWDTSPYFSVDRLWNWQDNQISRHTKNLLLKFNDPIPRPRVYRRQLDGVIEKIQTQNGQLIPEGITVRPSQEIILQAQLKNTGKAQWFGYDTGLRRGRAIVKVQFFDRDQQRIPNSTPNLLFVQGTPRPGEATKAMGAIVFPQQPGTYQMVFTLGLERMGNFPPDTRPVKLIVQVTQSALGPQSFEDENCFQLLIYKS
jgi:hypothetical protein